MTSQPQDRSAETDQPNEFGFAGGATAPQPERTSDSGLHDEVEVIAVPSGDITGAITESTDDVTDQEDRKRH